MREIDSLLERAKKYIKSAQILIDSEDYESAVSRVYYAMFYAAEAILLTKELSFSSHKMVISSFGRYFVKDWYFSKRNGERTS